MKSKLNYNQKMSTSNQKIITVLGGTGYIGKRCVNTLLKNFNDIKIYIISRKEERPWKSDPRIVLHRGDALHPEEFEEILLQSTGIIHSIGTLITMQPDNYMMINKESCLRPAKHLNKLLEKEKIDRKTNFVYISAERGLPFPLSLKFGGYISAKRQAEKELLDSEKLQHINPIILRPGFVKDNTDRLWSVPLYHSVNLVNFAENHILSKIIPNIGETMQLPAQGIELDTLSKFASAGAVGNLTKSLYSNDEMINNVVNLNLI